MTLSPARGVVLVKPIETQETVAGGLVVLTENARKDWAQWQMEVVAVGLPTICAKPKKCHHRHWFTTALDISGRERGIESYAEHDVDSRLVPGAWVIVEPRSIVPLSLDTDLFAVRQEQVVGVFREAEHPPND